MKLYEDGKLKTLHSLGEEIRREEGREMFAGYLLGFAHCTALHVDMEANDQLNDAIDAVMDIYRHIIADQS